MKLKKMMVCFCALMMFMSVSLTTFASSTEWVKKTVKGIEYGYRINADNAQIKGSIEDVSSKLHTFKIYMEIYDENNHFIKEIGSKTVPEVSGMAFPANLGDAETTWKSANIYYVMDGKITNTEKVYSKTITQ